MKEKKRDPRTFDHVSYRILAKNINTFNEKLTNGLFSLSYDVADFIFRFNIVEEKLT